MDIINNYLIDKNMTMFICQFWNDFWPNFVSTLAGLTLGLPLALFTNRLLTNIQKKKEKLEKIQIVKKALEIIKQTLYENEIKLNALKTSINSNMVQFDAQLDFSAWDAVKDDLVKYLTDSGLKRTIAYHFSKLQTLTKLNSLYLDFSVGVGSHITQNDYFRKILKGHLLHLIGSLLLEIVSLLDIIDDKIKV